MRKLLAGLSVALAMLIMALAMAPPNAGAVAAGSPDSQVTLFIDDAALAGRPGGAVLTDTSYADQLGAIALDSMALDTQAVGVAMTHPNDWYEGQQGSAGAYLANSISFAVARDIHTDDIFGGPMTSAGIAFVSMKRAGTFPQYTASGSA